MEEAYQSIRLACAAISRGEKYPSTLQGKIQGVLHSSTLFDLDKTRFAEVELPMFDMFHFSKNGVLEHIEMYNPDTKRFWKTSTVARKVMSDYTVDQCIRAIAAFIAADGPATTKNQRYTALVTILLLLEQRNAAQLPAPAVRAFNVDNPIIMKRMVLSVVSLLQLPLPPSTKTYKPQLPKLRALMEIPPVAPTAIPKGGSPSKKAASAKRARRDAPLHIQDVTSYRGPAPHKTGMVRVLNAPSVRKGGPVTLEERVRYKPLGFKRTNAYLVFPGDYPTKAGQEEADAHNKNVFHGPSRGNVKYSKSQLKSGIVALHEARLRKAIMSMGKHHY